MPKRYDNPQEILKIMRKTELLKQSAERSPFTGILTLFCYTLWKDYKYSQTRLSDSAVNSPSTTKSTRMSLIRSYRAGLTILQTGRLSTRNLPKLIIHITSRL